MPYQIREAARENAKPLVGLVGQSDAGKTYTALLVARGFVGPQGRIVMIETEAGRGEAYARPDEYPEFKGPNPRSNYDVIPMREDFSPKAYGEALTEAEKAGCDALIIDSASHEWEGRNGVLDQAAAREESGMQGALVWQRPKMDHNTHFVLRFTQTPIPLVILCMRGKKPMERRKKSNGQGYEWFRSDELEPIQSDGILSEMFVQGVLEPGTHNFVAGKISARALAPIFETGKPLTLETGRLLRQWAEDVAEPEAQPEPPAATDHAETDPADSGQETNADKFYRATLQALKDAPTTGKLQAVWKGCQPHLSGLSEAQRHSLTQAKDERKVELA